MRSSLFLVCIILVACGSHEIGRAPEFTPTIGSMEQHAMLHPGLPGQANRSQQANQASLWSRERQSLLGDRRAANRGDILTVVIEVDEKAEISNATNRSRSGSESLSIPDLFGIPQRINDNAPDGASLNEAVSVTSGSSSDGNGSVSRREKLTLRLAASIIDELPNGVLAISGSQELRVNFELRELIVTGYVRPEDISRQNEITYDKIAAARVSYGGRGQITDVQQPRYGQQLLNNILPF